MIVNNPPSDATAPKTVLYIDNRIVKSRLPTCTCKNVISFTTTKNGGHFERRTGARLSEGGGICCVTAHARK